MKTLLLRIHTLRVNGPVALLLVLLQRTPVLQTIARAEFSVPSLSGGIVRSVILAVASGSAVHTLTGATKFTSNPTSPASATVGVSFSLVFAVTGAPSVPGSYKITGTLPPGLTVPGMNSSGILNASSGSITGIPTQSGSYTTFIQAYEFANATGETNKVAYPVQIDVSGGSTSPPSITSQPQSLTLTVGQNGSFSVTASGTPNPTYQWQKNGANIAGATAATLSLTNVQSSDAASYTVVVTNSAGSVTSNAATLTVNAATATPSITTQPQSLTVTTGQNASFSVVATGTPSPTYQWRKNGANIAGATAATLSLTNVQSSDAASYTVVVTNSAGSVTSNAATLTVSVVTAAPTITTQPQSLMLPVGYEADFTVAATSDSAIHYQWMKAGVPIPGAVSSTYSIPEVQLTDAGPYTVAVANDAGTTTSEIASLDVGTDTGRLVNLSCRGNAQTGNRVLIPGMYFSGTGTKRVLIRAIGPTLALPPFNVQGALQDPYLRVFDASGRQIYSNDNWGDDGDSDLLGELFQEVGAFALPEGSKDAVVVADIPADQGITYHVSGADGGTGISVVEIYEIDGSGRMTNLSTRGYVGVDQSLIIPGVAIVGDKPKTLLIRAVGPGIGDAPFNVPGVLADPVLRVMDSTGQQIMFNDDWGSAPNLAAIRSVMPRVGAFPLKEGSKDSVILAVLPPGAHTFHVMGKNGTTGIALVEIYEVPDGP